MHQEKNQPFQEEIKKAQEMMNDEQKRMSEARAKKREDTFGGAPEKWRDFYIKYKKVQTEALNKIFSFDQEKKDYYFKKFQDQQKKSFVSVKDPTEYLTCHISVGSSIGPIGAPKLDFEGEYSLYDFFQKLLEEMNNDELNS